MFSQVSFVAGDGLTPTLELRDTTGATITGYAPSSAGIFGVGGGSGNYCRLYTNPPGYAAWLEVWTDGVTGGQVLSNPVNDHWQDTGGDGLTYKQSDAIRTAYLTRPALVSYTPSTRTQVTVYYKADGVTPIVTTTTIYDVSGRVVTRTTVYSNLP